MGREQGFYWVQYRGTRFVAEWARGASGGTFWYLPGYERSFDENEMQDVVEQRIVESRL